MASRKRKHARRAKHGYDVKCGSRKVSHHRKKSAAKNAAGAGCRVVQSR